MKLQTNGPTYKLNGSCKRPFVQSETYFFQWCLLLANGLNVKTINSLPVMHMDIQLPSEKIYITLKQGEFERLLA